VTDPRVPLRAILQAQGRKRPLTLRPITTTKAQARALARIYAPIMQVWADGVRDRILPTYARSLATFTGDSPADLEIEIEAVDEEAVRATFDFRAFFREWAEQLALWHVNRIGQQLTYATNVDLTTQLGGAQGTIDDLLARNVSLVRDVSDQARGRIADIVFRGLQARTPIRDVARELNDALDLGRARSVRIASDQTVKLSAALDRVRQEQLGFTEFVWQHSGKLHYRPEHKERDGKVFSWESDVALTDPPGQAPFCFPSDQPIAVHDDVLMFWRRWHSGHLTTLVTESGETVRCTPNHPVLTNSGWKAAKSIDVGDYLVRTVDCGVYVPDADVHEAQTGIGNLFEASKAVFGSVTIDGSGPEFHGDATPDEQIEVVDTKRGLRHHFVSLADENVKQLLLEKSLGRTLTGRALELFGKGSSITRSGEMGGLRLLESLLWAQFGPLQEASGSLVPQLDALFLEVLNDSWSGRLKLTSELVGGSSCQIKGRQLLLVEMLGIVGWATDRFAGREAAPVAKMLGESVTANSHIRSRIGEGVSVFEQKNCQVKSAVTRPWSGHVYNLESVSGWYSAGNIAVKNCGCKARAHMEFE
jgi:hypothetical protein